MNGLAKFIALRSRQGTATAKKGFHDIHKGETGILTAYLPKDKTFAIYFGDGRWHTFTDTEETFLEKFEIKFDR